MRKVLFQGTISLLIFFGSWLIMAQVEWTEILRVDKQKDETESALAEILLKDLENNYERINDSIVISTLDTLLKKLEKKNIFDREDINLHIFNNSEINAYALPDGHIVINSGLIHETERPEELAGVMAHEIAHIQANHAMKKLVREFGLNMLISMISGGAGSDVLKQSGRLLSSRAFNREMEQEADRLGVQILNRSGISAEPLADFLYLLANYNGLGSEALVWLSTHPELKSRAAYILEFDEPQQTHTEALIEESVWAEMKSRIHREVGAPEDIGL